MHRRATRRSGLLHARCFSGAAEADSACFGTERLDLPTWIWGKNGQVVGRASKKKYVFVESLFCNSGEGEPECEW